jgi:shikimate dehydrogenase
MAIISQCSAFAFSPSSVACAAKARWRFNMREKPILAGVIGSPVAHSLSPLIHTIWARRAQIDGYYMPIEVPTAYDDFAKAMDALKTIGFAGVNVTLPHKENALRYSDIASELASKTGAANMLTFTDNGSYADNSDVTGFESAVKNAAPGLSVKGACLVLGAGGASRAIIIALQNLGAKNVFITNRTEEKAAALAEKFGLKTLAWAKRKHAAESADLVVNTTSLGMSGQPPLELGGAKIKPGALVADIVYTPLETALLKRARDAGNPGVNGLAMLMHQAAPGFRAWFGGEAEVDDDLRTALVDELERRRR